MALAASHRAQLLNYLLLCDVEHGKLINVRSEEVVPEFVNTLLKLDDRIGFEVCLARWQALPGAERLPEVLVPLLRELGTVWISHSMKKL